MALSIAALSVSAPAGNALAAGNPLTAGQALAVGGPAGGFDVPAGQTASFTNVLYSACNNRSWGYQLSGGTNQGVGTFGGGCHAGSGTNATIGPFATDMTLRVFLTDNHCHFTYYSDGTPVDHVIVEGSHHDPRGCFWGLQLLRRPRHLSGSDRRLQCEFLRHRGHAFRCHGGQFHHWRSSRHAGGFLGQHKLG